MTISVLDYRDLWEYFDPIAYPQSVQHSFTRELYAPAQGWKRSADVVLPSPPTGPIRKISYSSWASGNYIKVKQLTVDYDPNAGPDGKSSTGLMGFPTPTTPPGYAKPYIVATVIDGMTIQYVNSYAGEIIDGMQFVGDYQNSTYTSDLYGSPGFNPEIKLEIPGHYVTSIYLDGQRWWNGDHWPDVLVVGFKMAQS